MNAEGYARAVSPEWVAATSTGFLWWALALWLVIGLGALWRRTLWQRRGRDIQALADASQGRVHATAWGFRVVLADAIVEWRYAPFEGPVTRGTRGKTVKDAPGWVDHEQAAALIA